MIKTLLNQGTNEENKYVVRWLQGKLKTGAAEKTVISALARAATATPFGQSYPPKVVDVRRSRGELAFGQSADRVEKHIMEAYCELPNFTEIISALFHIGANTDRLRELCHMRVGVPISPMLAKPITGI